MTTYDRIEKLRKEKGISQGKMEKELGLSNGLISKWKTNMPKADTLKTVADFFEVPMEYLLTGKMPTNDGFDETEINLIRSFRRLNKYGKEKILNDISDCLMLPKYTEKNASRSEVV